MSTNNQSMPKEFHLFPNFLGINLSASEIKENIKKAKKHIEVADNRSTGIEAGQTYMGQFIAHEIVATARNDSRRINNSPGLDLKSLYGDGYANAYFNAKGHFILGKADGDNVYGTDLFRDNNGVAMIPELRNDENIILSQFHLFWQKVHNTIIDHLREQSEIKVTDYFNFTRNVVVLLFHRLVKEDFLKQLIMSEIYEYYFRNGSDHASSYLFAKQPLVRIPIEFSRAAFRFAHSMVREHYRFSTGKDEHANSEEIFKYRGSILPSQFKIKWDFFFQTDRFFYNYIGCANNDSLEQIGGCSWLQLLDLFVNGKMMDAFEGKEVFSRPRIEKKIDFQISKAIDTKIVKAMTKLPSFEKSSDNKKTKKHNIDIRDVDLDIAYKSKMASGIEIFDQIKNVIEIKKIMDMDFIKEVNMSVQDSFKNLDHVPLWLYVLKEAELTGLSGNSRPCKNLGCVGSFIVIETLLESLALGESLLINLKKNRVANFIESTIFKGKSTRYGHLINYLKKRGTI